MTIRVEELREGIRTEVRYNTSVLAMPILGTLQPAAPLDLDLRNIETLIKRGLMGCMKPSLPRSANKEKSYNLYLDGWIPGVILWTQWDRGV